MLDHEERTCPRCGEPAGDHRLWPSCGLNLAPVSQNPGAPDRRTDYARVEPREAFRWEGPSGPVSSSNGQVSATFSESSPVEPPTVEMKLVRLEAVDTPPCAPPVLEIHPALPSTEPVAPSVRLEAVAEPTEVELGSADNSVVEPREDAPWWEQAASLEVVGDPTEAEREVVDAGDAISANVEPAPPTRNPHASAEHVVTPAIGRSSGRRRVAVVCLAALMGLVAALAGRHLRRHA
jgi:hypothetical protein